MNSIPLPEQRELRDGLGHLAAYVRILNSPSDSDLEDPEYPNLDKRWVQELLAGVGGREQLDALRLGPNAVPAVVERLAETPSYRVLGETHVHFALNRLDGMLRDADRAR